MSKFCFVADSKIDEVWSNQSLSEFAVIPADDERETMDIVDELVAAYVEAPGNKAGSDAKNDALAELYDLHATGRILWPLGALIDRSVLGDLSGFRFSFLIKEEDPAQFEIRADIEESNAFKSVPMTKARAEALSFEFWRLFMILRLATTDLSDCSDIEEAHLFTLVRAMQVDGVWADWVSEHARNRLKKFGRFLANEREEPMFASSFLNPARRMKLGPRIPSALVSAPHLAWIFEAFDAWMDLNVSMTKRVPRKGCRLLTEFLATLPAERSTRATIFSRENVKQLLKFAASWSTPTNRGLAMSKIMDFAEWFCLDFAEQEGFSPAFEIKRHDVEQFLRAIPPMPVRAAEVTARPMPARFHHMLKEMIKEKDFEWPKTLASGVTGNKVHWFPWEDPVTGKVQSVFCEVLPRILLLQLDLPLRNIQVRRLDSGEGDDREYDLASGKWQNASGRHARYWSKRKAKNPHRGAIREIATSTGTLAGFWINTNKTADSNNLFDETSGYEIPWQHDDVLENVVAMRKWQEKYNPVDGPLPHAELPPGVFEFEDPTEAVRALIPDRFYLFRYPQNVGPRGKEAPPGRNVFTQFFLDALDELEKRLRIEDPEADINIITERDVSGQPRKAIFTVHGMRSSTLTSLYMAGVPIGILSKLVAGHATILMTLRYTKFDPAHVNQILKEAWSKNLSDQRGQFDNFLKNATLEQAIRMTARLTDDGLHQVKNSYTEPTAWSRMDIGICPNGGTQCHIGGELLHRRKEKNGQDKSSYKPVPGGARNCVRCRFFVTGLPFLIALCAHVTSILARIDGISKRIASLGLEVQEAKRERLSLGNAVPASLSQRIRILEEHYYAQIDARDQALADVHATMVYVEKVRAISAAGDSADDAKLPMLLGAEGTPQVNFRESTRFELVDAVVQSSRWFPSLTSAELEAERDEFLNHVLWRNGYVPITLSPLSAEERRRAADALAQLLLVELGATETQNVIEGRKTLADLGLQEKLERAAAAAIGHPIERLSLAPPATITIEATAE